MQQDSLSVKANGRVSGFDLVGNSVSRWWQRHSKTTRKRQDSAAWQQDSRWAVIGLSMPFPASRLALHDLDIPRGSRPGVAATSNRHTT